MPARQLKPVEANDGTYGGLVLDAYDRLARPAPDLPYAYVRRMYGVDPRIGGRVRHKELVKNNLGTIAAESPSQGHYVMVRFDGLDFASPCHPDALEYLAAEDPR